MSNTEHIKTCAVVAMAENGCIGKDGTLPWHIPEDLKFFKRVTMGKPVIMGRKTYESIIEHLGKPLPGRANLVITRGDYSHDGAEIFNDLDSAVTKAKEIAAEQGLEEIIIGGGGNIYEQALPLTDRIYLTKVHAVVNGDTFFPSLNEDDWDETERDDREGAPSYSFLTLDRRR